LCACVGLLQQLLRVQGMRMGSWCCQAAFQVAVAWSHVGIY
jgi:hypothetical protein